MHKSSIERGMGVVAVVVSPPEVQCTQKRRPDASKFQLGNGS